MATPLPPVPREGNSFFTWLAALVSIAALAGSIFLSGMEIKYGGTDLSFGLGLRPCSLCLYERTFLMAVVSILVVGLLVRSTRPGLLSALALPVAVAGLALAGQQVNLEQTGRLECVEGIHDFGELGTFYLGTVPQQSLALFAGIALLLLLDVLISGANLAISVFGVIFGLLLAVAVLKSEPATPAEQAANDMCRPL